MGGTIESTCPNCGSLLNHRKPSPGGASVPIEVTCPNCDYQNSVEQ